jgi:hypothetical protein
MYKPMYSPTTLDEAQQLVQEGRRKIDDVSRVMFSCCVDCRTPEETVLKYPNRGPAGDLGYIEAIAQVNFRFILPLSASFTSAFDPREFISYSHGPECEYVTDFVHHKYNVDEIAYESATRELLEVHYANMFGYYWRGHFHENLFPFPSNFAPKRCAILYRDSIDTTLVSSIRNRPELGAASVLTLSLVAWKCNTLARALWYVKSEEVHTKGIHSANDLARNMFMAMMQQNAITFDKHDIPIIYNASGHDIKPATSDHLRNTKLFDELVEQYNLDRIIHGRI